MVESTERWGVRVMSGEARGIGPSLIRAGTAIVEPFYAAAMRGRNIAYDRGIKKIHRLPRPTVSIGNITTGGTGKTPMVRWLAERLVDRGFRPAVLMRGYRGESTGGSDEQRLLIEALGDGAIVVADPDRVAGAASAMATPAPPDVFLLDDGFQHRRAGRDFDLVLVDATQPFGFGQVLPRGLLREPLGGLARANAVVITRSDQIPPNELGKVEAQVLRHAPDVSIYRSRHVHAGLKLDEGEWPIEELSRRRFFVFSGIGNPSSLRGQLDPFASKLVGWQAFADHQAYTAAELSAVDQEAAAAGAELLVTTEKDWVKIESLRDAMKLPVARLDLRIAFAAGHEDRLLAQIGDKLNLPAASSRVA